MKLLLIEDDRAVGDIVAEVLALHHWAVERADDGEAGLALATTQSYDLILLDIGLPKLDGITVCKRLRSHGYQNPILLLTGSDTTEAQVSGLDAGADDYVAKPFDVDVLLARIRAVVRKGKTATAVIQWENIQIDPIGGEVTCNGQLVHLTAKEFGLLELFLINPKRIYSRRAILDHLWDIADVPGEETVSTHIKCIRQKLKAVGGSDPIETVHGLGYRLRSTVSEAQDVAQPIGVQPEQSSQSSPSSGSGVQDKAQAVAHRVWNQFKTQYLEQNQTLAAWVYELKPGPVPSHQQEIRQLAHKLAGSLGMFGLGAASQQAKMLEQLMLLPLLEPAQIDSAIQSVNFLKQEIEQAQAVLPPKLQPLTGQSTPNPPTKKILIVDDDTRLADRLRIEAIAWNLQVDIASDLAAARQIITQAPPSLILLDISFPGEDSGLTLLQELDQRSAKIPVVVLTAKEDLHDRVIAARLGVRAFLHKPLPAYEILKTLTDVLSRDSHQAGSNRILVVDDDPGFLKLLSELLSTSAVAVTVAADPQTFWQVLANCHPDVLILDLEMPEFDGLELCQVVRTDPQWQHLKVLFLSVHTEPDVITRAYAAGADDYISKAMPATDIVTRILNRMGYPHLPNA